MAGKSYGTKVGDRFGSRIIVELLAQRDSDGHQRCRWKCDCGAMGTGGLKSLRHTATCQKCRPDNLPHAPTHGHSTRDDRTKLYDAWANMRQRTNPNSGGARNRKWYGDKGVTVCPEWQTFEPFRDWAVAHGYRTGLSLDRIYSWGNYAPGNCEWITQAENSRRAVQDKWRGHRECPVGAVLGFGV